jgi:DnaK suppressor protein
MLQLCELSARSSPLTFGSVSAEDRSADVTIVDVAASVEADLVGVERAMARLDDGTYELCEVCGRAIGEDRLSAVPYEPRCAICAS